MGLISPAEFEKLDKSSFVLLDVLFPNATETKSGNDSTEAGPRL
jgi:hypothetical protein